MIETKRAPGRPRKYNPEQDRPEFSTAAEKSLWLYHHFRKEQQAIYKRRLLLAARFPEKSKEEIDALSLVPLPRGRPRRPLRSPEGEVHDPDSPCGGQKAQAKRA